MQMTHLCHARDARGAETGGATAAWSVRAGEVTDQRTSLALAECMRAPIDEHYPEAERFASCSTTGLPIPLAALNMQERTLWHVVRTSTCTTAGA